MYDGFDVSKEIEPQAWREVLRIINEASVEGLIDSGHETHEQSFLRELRHSNEVFSAFKCHSMGVQMQKRLFDEEGKLRSYEDWKKSIAPIASHQVGSWLRTEYDTAILRAHQASDWQEFVRNRDVLPNLRWMPTTSPSPEAVHETFWESGLTLPVDDPFWKDNHPANRWNCKCSLEATDAPSTGWEKSPNMPKAQQGLEENPRHGHTFSDKHPYFPSNCSTCPFNKGAKKGLKGILSRTFQARQTKDCYHCPYIDWEVAKAKYPERYEEYLQLKKDKEYGDVEFDPETGGIKASHIGHKRNSTKETYFGEEKLTAHDLEEECADTLFHAGHKVIFLDESKRDKHGDTFSALDIAVDGVSMDIRSITQAKSNYVNALTAKNKQLERYNLRSDVERADSLCLYFHDPAMFSDDRIKASIRSYNRIMSADAKERGQEVQQSKKLLIVINGERKVRSYDV